MPHLTSLSENGLNQAIELSADVLSNVKFMQEKKLITEYFDQIYQDTGRYCFGIEDTFRALEAGAVEKLICWESLDYLRCAMVNPATNEKVSKLLRPEQLADSTHFVDKETGMYPRDD